MESIAQLLCGGGQAHGIARTALEQLSRSIDDFSTRAINFLDGSSSDDAVAFGSFCARVLLENGCAALVGRLDSFRLLYLSEFQSQPEYEPGRRAKSAFAWSVDVIPEEKPPTTLWSTDHDLSKISRALFSHHMNHVCWKPAVEQMLDFVSTFPANVTLKEVLKHDAETYLEKSKGQSRQLYSTLSKAVHWEFFTTTLIFDEATVKTNIRDTCMLIAHLGLVSHFIPTAYASVSPESAVQLYVSFVEKIS
jgi:hypothetical protein